MSATPNTWSVKWTGTISVQWYYSLSDHSVGCMAWSYDPNGSESPESAAARILYRRNEWWAKEQRRRRDEERTTAALEQKIRNLTGRIRSKLIALGETVQTPE